MKKKYTEASVSAYDKSSVTNRNSIDSTGITTSKTNLVYSAFEQGSELLDYDKTSSDEEILGASFNIQYQKDPKQFIPCNKTHKIFTEHENDYRKKFYLETDGTTTQGEPYQEYYHKIEKNILNDQEKLKEKKKNFKQDFKRDKCINPQDIQDLKEKEYYIERKHDIILSLAEAIGSPRILPVAKTGDQPNSVYPNFAIAQIDYIRNNKVFSKFCEEVKSEGHSEAQIFNHTSKVISKDAQIKASEFIILNMHTTLSMCDTCLNHAEKLITEVRALTQRYNFKINVSYKFPYSSSPKQNPQGGLFQQQIEISDVTQHDQTIFDNIVPSSGYNHSPTHKKAIEHLSPKKKVKDDMNVFDISKPSCSKDLFNENSDKLLKNQKIILSTAALHEMFENPYTSPVDIVIENRDDAGIVRFAKDNGYIDDEDISCIKHHLMGDDDQIPAAYMEFEAVLIGMESDSN